MTQILTASSCKQAETNYKLQASTRLAGRLNNIASIWGRQRWRRPLPARDDAVHGITCNRALLHLEHVDIRAIAGNVHVRWTAVRMSHIAGEYYVFSIT